VALFLPVIRSERDMTVIVWACLVGVAHAAFMHVIGTKIGWAPPSHGAAGFDAGVLIEYQGVVLILFVPTLILNGIYARRWYGRLFCWAALPLVLNSIVNTYMRTVFVGLLLEVVLILVVLPKRLLWTLIPVIGFGLGFFLFVMTPPDYWERIGTIFQPKQEASAASRFVITEASLKMLRDYPLGVGYRNYPDVSPQYLDETYLTYCDDGIARRSAHSTYFSVLCETGVLGFAIWVAVVVGALVVFRKLRKSIDPQNITLTDIYGLGFEIGIYGWLIGGFTSSLHEVDPAYWFMGFGIILWRLKHQKREQDPATSSGDDEEPSEDRTTFPTEEVTEGSVSEETTIQFADSGSAG
jgi:O-antigen ligase